MCWIVGEDEDEGSGACTGDFRELVRAGWRKYLSACRTSQ